LISFYRHISLALFSVQPTDSCNIAIAAKLLRLAVIPAKEGRPKKINEKSINNMKKEFSGSIGWLRIIGIAEGISLLVLMGIAMPLKYLAGKPEAVKYTGWIHGLLFVAFIATVLYVYFQKNWPFKRVVIAFIAAFLPFGTFVFDKWLQKQTEA
jgi:integral membrane protein